MSAIRSNTLNLIFLKAVELGFPLLTIPWLLHALSLGGYGHWVLMNTVAGYLSLVIAYGFEETATRQIALDHARASIDRRYVCSVFQTKALVFFVCAVLYLAAIVVLTDNPWLWASFVLVPLAEVFNPLWYYQGSSQLGLISRWSLWARILNLLLLILFVREPADIARIPWIFFITQLVAAWIPLTGIVRTHAIADIEFHPGSVVARLAEARTVFASNLVISIKDRVGALCVGVSLGTEALGIYDLIGKMMLLIQQPAFVLNNAFFPRLNQPDSQAERKKLQHLLLWTGLALGIGLPWPLEWLVSHYLPGHRVHIAALQIACWSPLFYGLSLYIGKNVFVVKGQYRLLMYCMVLVSAFYLAGLGALLSLRQGSLYNLVALTVLTYAAEALLRWVVSRHPHPPSA